MLAGRVVARRGADAVEWYRKMLTERPIAANALTCGTLYAAGDCIAQQLERIFGLQSPGKSGYNYRRTLRVFVGGACYAGPCMALWYPRLHLMTAPARRTLVPVPADARAHPRLGPELYEKVPCTSPWKNVAAKIFLDNACDAASICILSAIRALGRFFQAPFLTGYFSLLGALEGLSPAEIKAKVKRDFHDAWGYSTCIWAPVGCVNFLVTPVYLQPVVINTIQVFWQTALSLWYHARDYGPDNEVK